ncbi:SAF domain-containing protein [Nocardia inohanensis]|uniref:SAF domain-containing protein n=1 Tax=Nocardia inohanensis TaxID=209246 RepID=UPI0008340CC2|nr:SAF domain-containing protein [Nocardia inohanensis]
MIRVRGVADLRPRWAGAVVLRRALAAGLLVVAGVLAVRGDPSARRIEVVVAARELPPGHVVEAGDVVAVARQAEAVPERVVRAPEAVVGATLAGAVAAGEMLTELRVVGTRLAGVAAGAADARIVPIRLADKAVAELLRAGDRVDVVAGEEGGSAARPARLLAADAAVVLVSGADSGRGKDERVVLVALDAKRAAVVAAASLRSALTVVLH